ncbi:transposase [Helcococcus kunzii]|nr:transposase [Helcococcus kunzii]QZO77323.1 transposase [Helcococcus kunzii]
MGFVEGHNNKTKSLKRLGVGFRSFKTFRTRRLIIG